METVHVFTSHDAANLAAANLQAHGIECWINSDDAGGMLPNLSSPGGVRLVVQVSDSAAALALLTGKIPPTETSSQNESEGGNPSSATEAPGWKIAPGQIIVGIIAGVIGCLFYQWCSQLGERIHYHHAPNGMIDKEWIYRDGELTEFRRDRNLDGAWDEWSHYKNGQIESAQNDNNFDGKSDETWFYSDGRLVRMEKDTDFNGMPDEFCTYKFGVISTVDFRPNGSKFSTERELYRNGVLVEILRGGDAEGNFKESVQYDPFFNPVSTNRLQ